MLYHNYFCMLPVLSSFPHPATFMYADTSAPRMPIRRVFTVLPWFYVWMICLPLDASVSLPLPPTPRPIPLNLSTGPAQADETSSKLGSAQGFILFKDTFPMPPSPCACSRGIRPWAQWRNINQYNWIDIHQRYIPYTNCIEHNLNTILVVYTFVNTGYTLVLHTHIKNSLYTKEPFELLTLLRSGRGSLMPE